MTTLRYELVNGHIIVRYGTNAYLIDTGAPFSIGGSSLTFGGREFRVQNSYLGVTLQGLSSHIGTIVHGLIGADILNNFSLVIDPRSSEIVLTEGEINLSGFELDLDFFMGIPIIRAEVNGSEIRMFFDTGAKLSYLDPEITENYQSIGATHDFYPGLGPFETRTYRVPIRLGSTEMELTVGTLPEMLQLTLMMADTSGILGTAILSNFAVGLNPGTKKLILEGYNP